MRISFFILLLSGLLACNKEGMKSISLESPNKINKIQFTLDNDGKPFYQVFHNDSLVIDSSYLGFDFLNAGRIDEGYTINNIENKEINRVRPPVRAFGWQAHRTGGALRMR